MKIAYILPSLKNCGPVKIAFHLCNYFSKKYHVNLFYLDEVSKNKLDFPVNTTKISLSNFVQDLEDYDIVHSHGFRPDLYVWKNIEKLKGAKITTIHGFHDRDLKYEHGFIKAFFVAKIWNFILHKFDNKVCITKSLEKYYLRKKLDNTIVIYNGIPSINISSKTDTVNDVMRVNISTVSVLNKNKGVEQIVKLLSKNQSYYLTAVGGGVNEIETLNKLALKLGVEKRCKFIGFVDSPWELVKNSDIFIFPSRSEAFGLALVEAACLEIPIICSDIPTFREMFEENEVTFFTLDDIDDLNNKVSNLVEVKAKARKAKDKVDKMFTVDTMCENYHQLYLRMTKKPEN